MSHPSSRRAFEGHLLPPCSCPEMRPSRGTNLAWISCGFRRQRQIESLTWFAGRSSRAGRDWIRLTDAHRCAAGSILYPVNRTRARPSPARVEACLGAERVQPGHFDARSGSNPMPQPVVATGGRCFVRTREPPHQGVAIAPFGRPVPRVDHGHGGRRLWRRSSWGLHRPAGRSFQDRQGPASDSDGVGGHLLRGARASRARLDDRQTLRRGQRHGPTGEPAGELAEAARPPRAGARTRSRSRGARLIQPASRRTLRWCETVGWLTSQHAVKSQAQTSPAVAQLAQDRESGRVGRGLEEQDVRIGLVASSRPMY